MRKIAVVGSGIIGLIAAHGLRRRGYAVTLYSDRTADQWLNESRPTGTAARFEMAVSYERELGLNHWESVAPRGEGVFLTFCPKIRKPLIELLGRPKTSFQAIDVRLQCHRWMNDFDGDLVIENVTLQRLDEIAKEHELTIVAAGKAELANLFPRDASRCDYDAPQRNLTMLVVTGAGPYPNCPFAPVKFEALATDGEAFFVPYLHKDRGPTWNLVLEAKPGGRMDRFTNVRSGEEALEIAKKMIAEVFPWSGEWLRGTELADPLGWLTGKIAPTVRKAVGVLPSGRIVTPLGDTSISYDPIAAQGANSGVKQARHLVESIAARGDRAFDAQWMTETFDTFFNEHARFMCAFNNMFLGPMPKPAQELLIAQNGSDGLADNDSPQQQIANAFFSNFNDPRELTPAFLDMARARDFIAKTTGRHWLYSAVRGRARAVAGKKRAALPVGNAPLTVSS
ncbi:MAG TPA: styrene monooxygenase/indole monooxygenase family protein [Thermoanaerobaculia bacterium]|nr:styrene monooxygenase/indole monooxygenase family protein [Thermoanaerobaculia bacterium]